MRSKFPGLPPTLPACLSWFLLVPEIALLTVLLCCYLSIGRPLLLAALTIGVVISFAIRITCLHLARSALDAGRDEAGALLRLAHLLHPWSADTYALTGLLALSNDAPREAEQLFRQAIQLLPGQAVLYAALSNALLASGQPAPAAAAARQACLLNPGYALAYLYLAEAERACGASSYAIEDRLREGLGMTQDVTMMAALQCALVEHLLREQRIAEATLLLHSVELHLQRCPASRQLELRFQLGKVLASQGMVDQARQHFQGVEGLDPHGRYVTATWWSARL